MKTEEQIRETIRDEMDKILVMRKQEINLRDSIQERQMFIDTLQWVLDKSGNRD